MENQAVRVVEIARFDSNFVGITASLVAGDAPLRIADDAGAVLALGLGVISVTVKNGASTDMSHP
jgi:hypothetical protein